ncbi:MAG: hypothetical protein UMR38_00410 [Candidatus Izemoplasma sp.]|nr:hypothetical protein [Candidatus Izemoplasma sp.]
MGKDGLQSYDIGSYDIQIDYDKKTTPIEKKIQTLEKRHQQKSDRAHKAFLKKQQTTDKKINTLREKNIVRNQKLDKATENKVEKVQKKITRAKDDYDKFVEAKITERDAKIAHHQEEIDNLKVAEQEDIQEIQQKYKENISSYVEKLDIYNDNYEDNIDHYQKEIDAFLSELNEHQENIKNHQHATLDALNDQFRAFNGLIESRKNTRNKEFSTHISESMSYTNKVRHEANNQIQKLREFITSFTQNMTEHYESEIEQYNTYIKEKKLAHSQKIELIDKDKSIQLEKLMNQKEELSDSNNKKALKHVDMKINLFEERAKISKQFETNLFNHQLTFLKDEKKRVIEWRDHEKINLKKLEIFLELDQQEIKDFVEYYDETNQALLNGQKQLEMDQFDAIKQHESRRKAYLESQLEAYTAYQDALIQLNDTHLNVLTDHYHEVDKINQFLDTAEPKKEIEVNQLKERLEIKETKQRFAVKYAKQNHDIALIKIDYDTQFELEAIERDQTIAHFQQSIDKLYLERDYDKEVNEAKLQYDIASEHHKVLMNNRKLERRLLDSQFDTKEQILTHQKEIAELDVLRENALEQKELEYEIKTIKNEANYKIEVINKGLEEDLLKHEEDLTKIRNEINAYKVNLDTMIHNKKADIEQRKQSILDQYQENLSKIDDALQREIKDPKIRLEESKHLIDTRIETFNKLNINFVKHMNDLLAPYQATASFDIETARKNVLKDMRFQSHVTDYIKESYTILNDAVTFMHDITLRRIDNKISQTRDKSALKKLKKQRQKAIDKYKRESKDITTATKDYVVVMTSRLDTAWKKFKKANITSHDIFIEKLTVLYHQIFDVLKHFQENVIKETKMKYEPLTETDQKMIEYAKESAIKAKAKIKASQANALAPLDDEFNAFVKDKQAQKEQELNALYKSRDELKATIQHLKNEALQKVKEVNHVKTQKLAPKFEKKSALEASLEADVAKRKKAIDDGISQLKELYNQKVRVLDDKNTEAKTILSYEENIYKMAQESAKTRLSDNIEKAQNAYRATMQKLAKKQGRIESNKKEQTRDVKAHLKDTSRVDEITTEVSIKQQIQDVKHRIDNEVTDKENELAQLHDKIHTLLQAAEDTLYTKLQKTKDALTENLEHYLDDCQAYIEHYNAFASQDNSLTINNLTSFKAALNTVKAEKYVTTTDALEKTNKSLFEEEE